MNVAPTENEGKSVPTPRALLAGHTCLGHSGSQQDRPGRTPSLLYRPLSPCTHPEGQPHVPSEPSPELAR